MKRIYKYQLIVTDRQDVQLPEGAEILTIQTQVDTPCLWALVDILATEAPTPRH